MSHTTSPQCVPLLNGQSLVLEQVDTLLLQSWCHEIFWKETNKEFLPKPKQKSSINPPIDELASFQQPDSNTFCTFDTFCTSNTCEYLPSIKQTKYQNTVRNSFERIQIIFEISHTLKTQLIKRKAFVYTSTANI